MPAISNKFSPVLFLFLHLSLVDAAKRARVVVFGMTVSPDFSVATGNRKETIDTSLPDGSFSSARMDHQVNKLFGYLTYHKLQAVKSLKKVGFNKKCGVKIFESHFCKPIY